MLIWIPSVIMSAPSEDWINNCQLIFLSIIPVPWCVTFKTSIGMELSLGQVVSVKLFGLPQQLKLLRHSTTKCLPSKVTLVVQVYQLHLNTSFYSDSWGGEKLHWQALLPLLLFFQFTLALSFIFWGLVLLFLKLGLRKCGGRKIFVCDLFRFGFESCLCFGVVF